MAQGEPKKNTNHVVVKLTMPMEEAWQVSWQGRGTHDPMGKLFDARQLDRRDLAWAIDFGWDPKFREAARTLLAYSIGEPAKLQFGARVIEGSHFLEEQETDSFATVVGVAGYSLGLGVALVIYVIQQMLSGQNWIGVIASSSILAAIAGLSLAIYLKHAMGKYRSFRLGREGEDKTVERIRVCLDGRWTIFRNLHLPGHNDDIDIVLVGPGGVWVAEVKSSKYTVRAEGKKWQAKTPRGWIDIHNNPFFQVTKDAKQLYDFFQRQGIVRWVERAIALSSPQPISNFEQSEIPVWLTSTIEQKVSSLTTRTLPSEQEIQKIVELLKGLADKQLAKENIK